MRPRPVLALVTTALLGMVLVGGSNAATPKACKLITDPAGDGYVAPAPVTAGPTDAGLDLTGGDLATNAKTLTAVIKVASLTTTPDPLAPMGRVYTFEFSVKGTVLYVAAGLYPSGNRFDYGVFDTTVTPNTYRSYGAATGTLDAAKKEIRLSVPVTAFAKGGVKSIPKGVKITGLHIEAGRFTGQNVADRPAALPGPVPFYHGLISPIDQADGAKGYVAGSPSCVVVK